MTYRHLAVAAALLIVVAMVAVTFADPGAPAVGFAPSQGDAVQPASALVSESSRLERESGVDVAESGGRVGAEYRGEEVVKLLGKDLLDFGPLTASSLAKVQDRLVRLVADSQQDLWDKTNDLERGASSGLDGYWALVDAEETFQIAVAALEEIHRGMYLVTEVKWAMTPLQLPGNYRAYCGTFNDSASSVVQKRFIIVPVNTDAWPSVKIAADVSAEVRLQMWTEQADDFNSKGLPERRKQIEAHFDARDSLLKAIKAGDYSAAKHYGDKMIRWPFLFDRVRWELLLPVASRK